MSRCLSLLVMQCPHVVPVPARTGTGTVGDDGASPRENPRTDRAIRYHIHRNEDKVEPIRGLPPFPASSRGGCPRSSVKCSGGRRKNAGGEGKRKDSGMMRSRWSIFVMGLLPIVLSACESTAETPGERFQKAIEQEAKYCATHKIERGNTRCEITKLKPADPLATEEGRFAHSIKIPNPVPEDSGYKSGMTPEQYFDHLCKTEAGEFIYKTVENVEGIYQMRPRPAVGYEANHLYAIEDPYGGPAGNDQPEMKFVRPTRYQFFESPDLLRRGPGGLKEFSHPSYFVTPDKDATLARYFGHNGQKPKTMQKEFDVMRKSKFGYTWRGITRPHDREMGVAGSELIVLNLETNEVLGVHRGYARFDIDKTVAGTAAMQWWKRCPTVFKTETNARLSFILKVLSPIPSTQGK